MTNWLVGLEGEGDERMEDNSQVASLGNWGPVDVGFTHRHLLIVVVGAGECTPAL